MNRNTYNLIVASTLIFCTFINYSMSSSENTTGTRSHSGGTISATAAALAAVAAAAVGTNTPPVYIPM